MHNDYQRTDGPGGGATDRPASSGDAESHVATLVRAGEPTAAVVKRVRAEPPDVRALVPPASGGIARLVHGSLRGRYVLVVLLGLLVGGGGGLLAWRLGRPIYTSEALLQIAYSMPTADGDGKLLPMFPMYMASQKTLIYSRGTIDAAIQQPVWKAMGRAVPDKPEQYFAKNMLVEIRNGSEFIRIVVSDPDPATAAAAVNAIVNAYQEQFRMQEERLGAAQRGVLEPARSRFQNEIKRIRTEIETDSKPYGSSNLDIFYEAALGRLNKLEAAILDLRIAIATGKSGRRPTTGPAAVPNDATAEAGAPATLGADHLSVEAVAALDPVTRRYLEQRDRLQEELRKLTARGLGEAHGSVKAARADLEDVEARLTRQANVYLETQRLTGRAAAAARGGAGLQTAGRTLEALEADLAALEALQKLSKEQIVTIGNSRRELQRKLGELADNEKELAKAESKLDQLDKQKGVGSRLTVISTGEIALSPSTDPRIRLAAAGGAAGAMLPAGLIVAMSLVWRRYRYSDEAERDAAASNVPLLGILPELKGNGGTPEDALSAAHSIHQLRVSLRARAEGAGWNSFLVTSAAAGEGKTSLTVSLGVSSAVARMRTLVVDADLVGRRLTDYFDAAGEEGLHEAAADGRLLGRVRASGVHPNLYLLPSGRASDRDACGLSGGAFRDLLEQARGEFDLVLIDTGPVLGSVEAAVLAPEADGVILVISQGQQRRSAERAVRRLEALGGRMVGMVFNRARPQDFEHSSYGSSGRSSVRASSRPARQVAAQPDAAPAAVAREPDGGAQ